ncbi:putative heat shock protein 70 family protein [Psychromonas ingrahamii 37]|uniref:Putative heat shock protein 70 family protein n=1 Tax=Psychromonas ingrahamii (strain DSM 17664 / CCUG 51855 / 37) TaxID=357804 RepID=A1SSA5_PSYIN|nr:molecular chaperone [Psychromonas ingrahamii]ABM02370.1 putative heat shock protein 70 family protein [Psychromonas ingrahamii 37]
MTADFIGIDFGTSNCAVAAWLNNKPTLIVVDKESENPFKIRSAIYLTHNESGAASNNAKTNEQTLNEMLNSGEILFGEQGFKTFLLTPDEGRYVNSPKNFLGAKIPKRLLDNFELLVVRFLSYLKQCAEKQLNITINKAVIARPVNYHSTMGELGNQQAEALMLRAATKAGFTQVDFIHEPLAAAYHFEQQIKKPTKAMVVDLGGGTSDVTFCLLSKEKADKLERDADIYATKGIRQGGIVSDKYLASSIVSPLFGRGGRTAGGRSIPNMLYFGVYAIDNIPEMSDFYSPARAKSITEYISDSKDPAPLMRLQQVQKQRLTHQLMHAIELAKIDLSDQQQTDLPLAFIDKSLDVTIKRDQVAQTMTKWLEKMFVMIDSAVDEAKQQPEIIYLTGGMGLSPLVQQAIKARYPEVNITVADAFSSVVLGALLKAKRLFS